MRKLEGKVAVVAAGNSGIGLATAKRFVAEGAYVFITARCQADLDKAVSRIGKNITGIPADISRIEDIERLYRDVVAKRGKIDILFADTGIDETTNGEPRGMYVVVQKALPFLNDGGSIILSRSDAWQKGIPTYFSYAATKAALRSFVRTWTTRFASRGIRANVISPGPIETTDDALRQQLQEIVPLGRIGRPEEVASAALFLASDESSFVNGIDLPVDGGAVVKAW
jgi:NAD(P)-dependent dehydrogenase (short-subunit alcohol dehydrogenase family)